MKLGTETGSVINHLQSRGVIGQPVPVVGMGCTILWWSDRHAGTIFRVMKVGKATILEVRNDKETLVSGSTHDGSAEWSFKVNVNGSVSHYRSIEGGIWHQVFKNQMTGRWLKSSVGRGLRIGERDSYRDPSH